MGKYRVFAYVNLGGGFKDFYTYAWWWFQTFFMFIPKLGEVIQIDDHIFEMGWFNRQLVCQWFHQKRNGVFGCCMFFLRGGGG